jgi:predicted PurR-regulated permease PerM
MSGEASQRGHHVTDQPRPAHPFVIGLAFIAVVALALILWRLSSVLILLFAALVVAAVLDRTARVTDRYTPLNRFWSKLVTWAVLAAAVAGFLYFLGAQIWEQLLSLAETLPRLLTDLGNVLGIENLSGIVSSQIGIFLNSSDLFGDLAALTASAVSALGMVVLIVLGGAFIAADPAMYRNGLTTLFPAPWDERVGRAIDGSARALSQWLLGKVIAMVAIGVATTIGLMLIGIPSALALGVLAGLLEFIPLIGPALSAIPALLVAAPEGYDKILWVLALYAGLQQVQSNFLVPMIDQGTAKLPPLLGLFSIVAFGSLFGFVGILVAAPLTVVLIALVKHLYLADILGRHVPPKEHGE